MTDFRTAREFAQYIKGLGFRAFVAKDDGVRGHGFITNADGSRVLSFQMGDGSLGGNYGPPTRESGTGWRLDQTIWDLHTYADVRKALNDMPPTYCQRKRHDRGGWEYLTTLEQHLSMYGSSSGYQEV